MKRNQILLQSQVDIFMDTNTRWFPVFRRVRLVQSLLMQCFREVSPSESCDVWTIFRLRATPTWPLFELKQTHLAIALRLQSRNPQQFFAIINHPYLLNGWTSNFFEDEKWEPPLKHEHNNKGETFDFIFYSVILKSKYLPCRIYTEQHGTTGPIFRRLDLNSFEQWFESFSFRPNVYNPWKGGDGFFSVDSWGKLHTTEWICCTFVWGI